MFFSVIEQARYEARSFVTGYPDFIYSPVTGSIRPQRPVFIYHTIEPREFEQQLLHLQENAYRTLATDDYVDGLQSPPARGIDAVLLTVDDGRSSFWRYGFPLLKRYGMRATLFIIPGRTCEFEERRPNLDDAWSGRCSVDDVHQADPGDVTMCTWSEIREMHNSGLVDIQSHSLFHGEVFAAPQLKGFIDESTPFAAYETPVTPYLGPEHAGRPLVEDEFYGLPLYTASPLYLGDTHYRPTPELMDFCRRYYLEEKEGNDWQRRLRNLIGDRFPDAGLVPVIGAEVARKIRTDLTEATALIRKNVDDSAGGHFCLPYAIGSELAAGLVKEAGLKSCFWGVIPGRRNNSADTDPWHLVRVKSDFLWRLPGKRRRSLTGTYWHKVSRRLRGQRFY